MQNYVGLIKENGWRQGAILVLDNGFNHIPAGKYIILSQDCDILHHNFEREPYVELIALEKPDELNGNYTHGKDPRTLQLMLNDSEHYICFARNRYFFDRQKLVSLLQNNELLISKTNLDTLIQWITKRYDRKAFPDEFNNRLENRNKLAKLLEKNGQAILGIYIRLHDESELASDVPYKIQLMVLVESSDDINNQDIANLLETFVGLIEQNAGILVEDDYQVTAAEYITLADYQNFSKWDFDYISNREIAKL